MPTVLLRCGLLLALVSTSWMACARPTETAPLPAHWRVSLLPESVFDSTVFVVEAGDAGKPTVLLIHGMGQAGLKDWISVIPALEADYHVVAMDLPGFGRSDKPMGKYSPANYARVVQQIKQQYSRGPVVVVGHSMGGAVALRYTALFPEAVKSTVLVAAAGILERSAFVTHSLGALIDGQQLPAVLAGAKTLAGQHAGSVMAWLNQLPDPTRALGNYQLLWGPLLVNQSNANAGLALVEEDFSAAIANSATPFYMLWGAQDRVAPLRTGKLLAGQLKHASLTVFDEAAHVPMHSHPERFNDWLLAALSADKVAPPSSPAELHCQGARDKVYSGHYRRVVIDHCQNIVLRDVVTSQLVINGSQLTLENLTVVSPQVAMIVDQSVVIGTNLTLSADTGIMVANSRLDLAGATLQTRSAGVVAAAASELVFSISRLDSAGYQGFLHGQYRLDKGSLDARLAR